MYGSANRFESNYVIPYVLTPMVMVTVAHFATSMGLAAPVVSNVAYQRRRFSTVSLRFGLRLAGNYFQAG